ncbi:MAG: dynamin family protein [Bacillota bacterium]
MTKDILLLGEFSTGKTAFVNMLLGAPVLPERVTSTDLPVVKISKGAENSIWFEDNTGSVTSISDWSALPENWTDFKYAGLNLKDHPLLKNELVIWDTPGINTADRHQQMHLENYLKSNHKNYELILCMLQENPTRTSLEFLKKYSALTKNMLIFINIKGKKAPEEMKHTEGEIKKLVAAELGTIPVQILWVGDILEDFYERYENGFDWRSDGDWSERLKFFESLIQKHIDAVIGEEVFDAIKDIAEEEAESAESYPVFANEKSSELSENRGTEMQTEQVNCMQEPKSSGQERKFPVYKKVIMQAIRFTANIWNLIKRGNLTRTTE